MKYSDKWPDWIHDVPIGTLIPVFKMPLTKPSTIKIDKEIELGNDSQWISTWLSIVLHEHQPHWLVNHRDSWRIKEEEVEEV